MASQPTNGTGTPILEKPKGRSAGEKRYRIELGCGSAAKEALDRWRLFVDTCDCSGPVELLHKALDSLLVQSRYNNISRDRDKQVNNCTLSTKKSLLGVV